MKKFLSACILACLTGLSGAEWYAAGECRGSVTVNGRKFEKQGARLSGKNQISLGRNSRLSLTSSDGSTTFSFAPLSRAGLETGSAGIFLLLHEGSVLVSCYDDEKSVTVVTAGGKRFSVKNAEALFSVRGGWELFSVVDGAVDGIASDAKAEKEIRRDFETRRDEKTSEKNRNAPLFDTNSARPGM